MRYVNAHSPLFSPRAKLRDIFPLPDPGVALSLNALRKCHPSTTFFR